MSDEAMSDQLNALPPHLAAKVQECKGRCLVCEANRRFGTKFECNCGGTGLVLPEPVAALVDAVAAELQKVQGRDRTIRLRCEYILGMCRGEDEMKAEARAILKLMGDPTNG